MLGKKAWLWVVLCRLNYIEQHAERLGMGSDRLDAARSSAARASPLGETLDICAVGVGHVCLKYNR